jgi:molybdopterin/thiamine biosynthesis adenylyltransferase
MNVQMLDYFARQSAIPEIGPLGLERLQSAELAVVGTGGVGGAAAYFLASLGIGHLKLIDQDIVDESNLHRLIGADRQDLHLPKAEVLGRKLNLRHHWTKIETVVETLRMGNSEELLSDVDLIVDGTDNFPARAILNRFAMRHNIPYLFTSAIANQGHLSLFTPPTTPCLECLMPLAGSPPADNCETLGVTPTIVGMVGSIAAAEAAKKILGLPTRILGHLLTLDLAGPDFLFTEIKRRESCEVCNGSSSEAVHRDNVVMLCGANVANILPREKITIDLKSLKTRLPKESVVASSDSVFVYTKQLHRISVFKTGRLLIGNVRTEDAARQVASEVWNEILS